MCKISIDTVVRANRRTISQSRSNPMCAVVKPVSPKNSFDVSVSVMGRVCTRNISAEKIKSSFGKALESHAKKL